MEPAPSSRRVRPPSSPRESHPLREGSLPRYGGWPHSAGGIPVECLRSRGLPTWRWVNRGVLVGRSLTYSPGGGGSYEGFPHVKKKGYVGIAPTKLHGGLNATRENSGLAYALYQSPPSVVTPSTIPQEPTPLVRGDTPAERKKASLSLRSMGRGPSRSIDLISSRVHW